MEKHASPRACLPHKCTACSVFYICLLTYTNIWLQHFENTRKNNAGNAALIQLMLCVKHPYRGLQWRHTDFNRKDKWICIGQSISTACMFAALLRLSHNHQLKSWISQHLLPSLEICRTLCSRCTQFNYMCLQLKEKTRSWSLCSSAIFCKELSAHKQVTAFKPLTRMIMYTLKTQVASGYMK